jgi:hypothetical protein
MQPTLSAKAQRRKDSRFFYEETQKPGNSKNLRGFLMKLILMLARPFDGVRFTNNAGRARHSVRAANCQPTPSAGRGLPAPPVFPSLFGKGIIQLLGGRSLKAGRLVLV